MNFKDALTHIAGLFSSNPLVNLISFVLGPIGIISTIYFYRKSKRSKIPVYMVRTMNLIRDRILKIESVKILYNNEKIDNLSIPKIAFWNDGKETIRNSDVATRKPVEIKIKEEFAFLDVKIIFQKNSSNDFNLKISEDQKTIGITFEYFDFNEGLVIQLFHTGNSSDDINLDGAIMSVEKIIRKKYESSISVIGKFAGFFRKKPYNYSERKQFVGLLTLITGIRMIAAGLFFLITKPTKEMISATDNANHAFGFIILLSAMIYIWFGFTLLKKGIPRGFNIFSEEF